MKNLKLAALVIIGTASVSAQDLKMEQVPVNLKSDFHKSYNNATNVEWELDGNEYNVEFDISKMEHEIWYNKDGKIVKMEKEIAESELPKEIVSTLKNNYDGYDVNSVELKEQNNIKIYEIELKKGWFKERDVFFDVNGKVLSDIED